MAGQKKWKKRAKQAEATLKETILAYEDEINEMSNELYERKQALDSAAMLLFDVVSRFHFDSQEVRMLQVRLRAAFEGFEHWREGYNSEWHAARRFERTAVVADAEVWLHDNGYDDVLRALYRSPYAPG